jgi:hypothetical protein
MKENNDTLDIFDSIEDDQQRNAKIMNIFQDAEEGSLKSASVPGSNMIRRRLREEGFTRRILPPKEVTNSDLNRVLQNDLPIIIEDMEPASKGAKSIPFGDSADTEFYSGDKYACVFNEITTPEFTKDINQLRTYKMDLRQVVTDNALKDMQTQEDQTFIATCDEIVGATDGVGAGGVQQNYVITGGFQRDTYAEATNKLEDYYLNNGVILMNRRTAKNFLKWPREEIGGDLTQEMFRKGMTALGEAEIMGVRHIFTIKRDIVPDNTLYIFGEPDYLGKFYTLQNTTMYIEKKKNILKFSARETISVTIANVLSVAKVTFTP